MSKIALDLRNLNVTCVKLRPHMPNIEELLYQKSTEKTWMQDEHLGISQIDLRTRMAK